VSQSNRGLRVITVGLKDPVCVSIYAASSEGYSKLSLSKALRRYISLPIASDQSAQLVPGLGGDRRYRVCVGFVSCAGTHFCYLLSIYAHLEDHF
jgi:hypothetical protein